MKPSQSLSGGVISPVRHGDQTGRQMLRILVRLLLGPSGCPKGDFLNIPSVPKSFFHERLQRAVTSNYAPVSEVTRCRRCLQPIDSRRQHQQNGLAWGWNGPRRLRMPCLLRTHRRSWNGGCDTESRVASLQVCEASERYSERPELSLPRGRTPRSHLTKT